MITVLFTISYISKKSEYLDNVNKEIERYNKEVYQNFQILQKIEDSFKELETKDLSDICNRKIYLELTKQEKILIRC